MALISSGRLLELAGPRLFADASVAASRAALWHLLASDDEHAFWTLLGSGRARVSGNFERLFEELPSDSPLLPPELRQRIRDLTSPATLGHLQVAAWKEAAP